MEVMTLFSDDYETAQAYCGENVKAKLKGVEEEVGLTFLNFWRCTSEYTSYYFAFDLNNRFCCL